MPIKISPGTLGKKEMPGFPFIARHKTHGYVLVYGLTLMEVGSVHAVCLQPGDHHPKCVFNAKLENIEPVEGEIVLRNEP